jgi:hypothetical protein
MPAPIASRVATELAGAAESATRLRALLEALRDQVEVMETRGLPQEPGRVAGRRLAVLKAQERRATGR